MVRNGHWIPPEGSPKVKGKLLATKPNGMCLPVLPRESIVPVEGCGSVLSPPLQDRMGMLEYNSHDLVSRGLFTMAIKGKITSLLLLDEMNRLWIVQKVQALS